jgi:hypothetical protein
MGVLLEDLLPGVKFNGLTTNKVVDFSSATSVALPAATTIAGVTAAGATTITSTSANSLAVGPAGTSNPAFNVDSSTASQAAGFNIVGATAAGTVAAAVISSGSNANLTLDAKGSGTIGIGTVSTGAITLGTATTITAGAFTVTSGAATFTAGNVLLSAGTLTVTSANAAAFAVGRLGATTPAFQVNAATGTQVTGIKVTGGAAAGTVAVAVQGGTNEQLTIDANGTGTISLGTTSTGLVIANRGVRKAMIVGTTLTAAGSIQSTTPTAAQLLGGFYSHISVTGAGTATLDTGSNISAAIQGVATGDSFTCVYANIGTQTVTITTNTGLTVTGTAAITTGKTGVLYFYNTAANTWTVYCTMS